MDRCVYQPLFFEYGENRENTSRTVHVLYVVVRIGCYFAKHRRLAGQGVYVLYRKVYSGLLGYGEQVQYRVGRAPMAISRVIALRNAARVAMLRGNTLSSPSW